MDTQQFILFHTGPQYRPWFLKQAIKNSEMDQVALYVNVGMGYHHFDSLDDPWVGSFAFCLKGSLLADPKIVVLIGGAFLERVCENG